MVERGIKEMVDVFLNPRNNPPEFDLPKPTGTLSLNERLTVIRNRAKLKEGVGNKLLLKNLEDFKNARMIVPYIKKIYKISPAEAGNYAHNYLGYNTFTGWYAHLKEGVRMDIISDNFQATMPYTKDIIKFRPDLTDDMAVYEFKLTKSKDRLNTSLRQALVQVYLEDFALRLRMEQWRRGYEDERKSFFPKNCNYFRRVLIDILVLDENRIYQYGTFPLPPETTSFTRKALKEHREALKNYQETFFKQSYNISVDAEIIKKVLILNGFQRPRTISKILNSIYKNIRSNNEEDFKLEREYLQRNLIN